VTCPSCDALLAAYEAPSGSGTDFGDAVPSAFDPVAPATESTVQPATPAAPMFLPIEEAREHVPFDATAALEESRRTLGMEAATPANPDPPVISTEPEPDEALAVSPWEPRELEPQPIVQPPAQPEAVPIPGPTVMSATRPAPTTLASAARQDVSRQAAPMPQSMAGGGPKQPRTPTVIPTEQGPSFQVGNVSVTAYQLGRIAVIMLIALVAIWVLTSLRIGGFFTIAVIVMVLINIMKGSAKKSGRKSTTMADPNDPNRWHG